MTLTKILSYLPRGTQLDDAVWRKRHRFLLVVLGLHLPAMFVLGLWLGHQLLTVLYVMVPVAVCVLAGWLVRQRRVASFMVTFGLVYTAGAFVVLSRGMIEAHFHFFVIIGLIALYQDWVPFMWNIVFTVFSHGLGSAWRSDLIFNHPAAQASPWLWSLVHGSAVVAACVGVVVFWRETEDAQQETLTLTTQLAEAEINQRKFTSDLLVNLARRNQSMLYRQLDIINQLEEKERDPDALGELFRLDHLATRIRRNAESLLVLSGEEPTRVWSEPVRLIDVVRAAIAETEDLDRVAFAVDERMQVLGHTVTDLTHVLAELTENAVRFSPPEANVTVRTRPYLRMPGAAVLTVEDWGVGMRPEDMAAANDLLAHPREVDLSVSQRLGLHVVARLAARHNIQVSLTPTPGTGVTAVVVLPAEIFAENPQHHVGPERLAGVGGGRRPDSSPVGVGPRAVSSAAAPAGTPSAPPRPGAAPVPSLPPDPTTPDIPMPRRTTATPNGNGSRNGNGSHGNGSHGNGSRNGNGSHGAGSHGAGPHGGGPHGADGGHGMGNGSGPSARPDHGNGQANRGMHARPEQDDRPDWTGWWTPTRTPVAPPGSYQVTQTYSSPEPVAPPSASAPASTTPALPAGPSRPVDSNRPAVIARDPAPVEGTTEATPALDAGGEPGPLGMLNRRVPQANLAPQLRRSAGAGEPSREVHTPPPDAERARDALSRFQASRQAAQEQVGAEVSGYPNGNGRRS